MSSTTPAREHEFEAQLGLPEKLPSGERILWQGRPDWRLLNRQVFRFPWLIAYFALIIALRIYFVLSDQGSIAQALVSAAWIAVFSGVALATVSYLAWLMARTTIYTITSKRVVMRIGIVLTLTLNLPFKRIEAAGLRLNADGSGDIPLTLESGTKLAVLNLWPHARPWRFARPEPMLRAVSNAKAVAGLLTEAWALHNEAAKSQAPGLQWAEEGRDLDGTLDQAPRGIVMGPKSSNAPRPVWLGQSNA